MKQKNNNKPRECTICGKQFASGKAMGGHMRAHFVNRPIPPAAIIKKKAVENSAESTHNHVGENLMLNSSPSSESSSQCKSPIGTRSKRQRKFMSAEKEAETKEAEEEQPVSSKPDPEVQHAAEILMDIQFDCKWVESPGAEMPRESTKLTKRVPRLSVNLVEKKEDNIQLNEFHNDEEVKVLIPDKPLGLFQTLIGVTRTELGLNYETSKQIFRSNQTLSLHNEKEIRGRASKNKTCHQALGFHHESHKEVQSKVEDNEDDDSDSGGDSGSYNDAVEEEKRHQCPVCFKMFASRQGLGGHKRVHKANAGAGKDDNPSATKKFRLTLDLNLPAPELDEEVISIGDLSTSSSDED